MNVIGGSTCSYYGFHCTGPCIVNDDLEETYLNGMADEVTGDVESPDGHHYRVGRWIVLTQTTGHKYAFLFDSEEIAGAAFQAIEDSFSRWQESDEGL